MQGIKWRRLGEDTWRDLLRQFEQGDESVNAFCRREGLSTNTFHRWRARLAVASEAPRSGAVQAKTDDASIPRFVDLGALRAPGVGRLELKLDLGAGVVLHVVRG